MILGFYFAINLSIYLFIYDNNFFVNIFIFIFNMVIWNSNDNYIFYVGLSTGFLFCKVFIRHFNVKRFRFFLFTIFAFISLIILMNLTTYLTEDSDFRYFERFAKNLFSQHFGFDGRASEFIQNSLNKGEKVNSFFMELRMINRIKEIIGYLKTLM